MLNNSFGLATRPVVNLHYVRMTSTTLKSPFEYSEVINFRMTLSHQHVLLIDGDPLVLEGMKLLLQDMRCEVAVVSHPTHQFLPSLLENCPHLIIASGELHNDVSILTLVNAIRAYYDADIPVILLMSDNDTQSHDTDEHAVCLPDDVAPQRLRHVITRLLDRASIS